MRIQLASNFYVDEFQTSQGELNLDTHHILILQALRSWLGVEIFISSGNRYPKWNEKNRKWRASAHDIYMPLPTFINDEYAFQGGGMITLPATASDVYAKGLDSWELMDKVEEFEKIVLNDPEWLINRDGEIVEALDKMDIFIELSQGFPPLFMGRGIYPDSNNQFVHLDCGHRSLNPRIRAKRTEITRWVRIKGVYHITQPGETFKQLRTRLEQ